MILPSRAFLFSWRDQTIPARQSALEDACSHFDELKDSEHAGLRDMALLGLIAESMQPLEDLACLGSAWDQPFQGLATYVRAITWERFTPTNFWQEVANWNDQRIGVFAGLSGRDPETGDVSSILDAEGLRGQFSDAHTTVIEASRQKTLERIRRSLGVLAADWKQFSPYYLAYKHGGLAVNRDRTLAVEDDAHEITKETAGIEYSIAVWRRGSRDQITGDTALTATQVATLVASSGRLAVDLVSAFIESRVSLFETLELAADGEVSGLKPMQLPWTVWLHEADLTEEQWRLIGRGPRINWIEDDASLFTDEGDQRPDE